MDVICLASSSKGNAYYISGGRDAILIDCGISCRRMTTTLQSIPGAMEKVRGILITHEHSDHTSGLVTLLKKHAIPAYASAGTWSALQAKWDVGSVDQSLLQSLGPEAQEGFDLGEFRIKSHTLSHDAQEPLGYVLEARGSKVGIATDTGHVTDQTLEALYDSDLLILEANHDPNLLQDGPYPAFLKARVASDYGHLSNASCGQALQEMMTSRTKHVILSHLSEKNNHPRLAFETVRASLTAASRRSGALGLWVATPSTPLTISLA